MAINKTASLILTMVGLALGISVGLTFMFLGCALPDYIGGAGWLNMFGFAEIGMSGWWAMFSLVLYLFTPMPIAMAMLFKGRIKSEDEEGNPVTSVYSHYGAFGTGFLGALGLGLLIVMIHSQIVGWLHFILNMIGGLIIIATLTVVVVLFKIYLEKIQPEF